MYNGRTGRGSVAAQGLPGHFGSRGTAVHHPRAMLPDLCRLIVDPLGAGRNPRRTSEGASR